MPAVICRGDRDTAGYLLESSGLEMVPRFLKARVVFLVVAVLLGAVGRRENGLWRAKSCFVWNLRNTGGQRRLIDCLLIV